MKSLSRVWLFVIPWTVAYQAPQSMEFSRQEYWSRLPFPSPGIFHKTKYQLLWLGALSFWMVSDVQKVILRILIISRLPSQHSYRHSYNATDADREEKDSFNWLILILKYIFFSFIIYNSCLIKFYFLACHMFLRNWN